MRKAAAFPARRAQRSRPRIAAEVIAEAEAASLNERALRRAL
jgi:hypothetical protein